MKCWPVFLCLSLTLLSVDAAGTKKSGFTVLVKYEGGTLPLNQSKVTATVAEDEVIFVHGNERFAVPLKSITALSCGTDVRRRFGASVLAMLPRMHLDKVEMYYVGLTWTGNSREGKKTSKVEAVLKLSNSEYHDFVAVLERLTGIKAVNADKVPTVIRYDL
jgi:hypothetical protein